MARSAPALGGTVAVVIPCYEAAETVADVIGGIGPEVAHVLCVDDGSRDATAERIAECAADDPRVRLIRRNVNGGVGAAVIDGYRAAFELGADVVVKVDADGQMDPAYIPVLTAPILDGAADYAKGNRFASVEAVRAMPAGRLIGNAALSFFSKFSTGYWGLFDPTNGFTALGVEVGRALPLEKVHRGYFFESDLLFRLNVAGARVVEVSMPARYGRERSHLRVERAAATFGFLHVRNFTKRVFYNHFLRNFGPASLNLVAGLVLLLGGAAFGAVRWADSIRTGVPATAGTVMLSALPVLVGLQLILSFFAYDMATTPPRASAGIEDRSPRTTDPPRAGI